MELDRKLVVVAVAVVFVVAVASASIVMMGSQNPQTIRELGGKYDAVVSYYGDNRTLVDYADETGNHVGDYYDNMEASLDWVKGNTPEDAVFLCWWDYGHMIKAYAEREAVVKDPSKEILYSVVDSKDVREYASHQTILGVADAFCTTDSAKTARVMQAHGATYILVNEIDVQKAHWIYQIGGLNTTEYSYQYWPPENPDFTFKAKQTMLARLLQNRETNPFTLVYSDETVKIYQLN